MEKKTISSQVFTPNGEFEIINSTSEKIDGKYIYSYNLKCVKCGDERLVHGSHKNKISCQNCKKLEKSDEFVNQIFGTYKIIKFSHFQDKRRYYIVECTYCGTQSVQLINHLKNNPGSCMSCKYERRNIIPTINAPRNCVKSNYITGAKNRNLEFLLSDEQFDKLIFSNCYFCGSEPREYQSDLHFNKTDISFKRNGIDRLDSSKGYTYENTVSCCAKCNLMKMTLHSNEFKEHIIKIYTHLVNKGSTTISKESTSQVNGDGNRELPTKGDDIVYSA